MQMAISGQMFSALAMLLASSFVLASDGASTARVGQHHHHDKLLTFERFLAAVAVTREALSHPEFAEHVKERFEAAKERLEEIRRNNSANNETSFQVDFMPHDLWTDDERAMLTGAKLLDQEATNNETTDTDSAASESLDRARRATYAYNPIDYVKLKMVTPVKNQGQCGSCYAFGAVAALESAYLLAGLGEHDLSEQQAVSCTFMKYPNGLSLFNYGCNGGNPQFVMEYFKTADARDEQDEPYDIPALQTQHKCSGQAGNRSASATLDYVYEFPHSDDHIAYMLEKNGPLAVLVHANSAFQSYSGGVFNQATCSLGQVNHVVLLTGLVKGDDGQELWVIKNSWGPKWGEQGFMRMPKGKNMCSMERAPVTTANINSKPVV